MHFLPRLIAQDNLHSTVARHTNQRQVGQVATDRAPVTISCEQHGEQKEKDQTYVILPFGPLALVYPLVYTMRLTIQLAPAAAAGTGYRSPAIKRVGRKATRFSVKFAWARCAQLRR